MSLRAVARLAVAIMVVGSSLGLVRSSFAAPSGRDVARVRETLGSLNDDLAALDERSNLARIRLEEIEGQLAGVRADADRARARAARAEASLDAAASQAYITFRSGISVLLDATSFADLSDELGFLGRVAQADADTAAEATSARREARWLADELARKLRERRDALAEVERLADSIRRRVRSAETRYRDLRAAFEASLAGLQTPASTTQAGGFVPSGTPPASPPPPSQRVEVVIAAARSVIGSPYVFGAADPAVGFDCSGLTMWSWAQAGVSLPHSSTLQHASLPHVDRSQLEPGDLVFFSFGRLGPGVIDDVGLYIGGGQMIASQNESMGVMLGPVDWDAYAAAGRPG